MGALDRVFSTISSNSANGEGTKPYDTSGLGIGNTKPYEASTTESGVNYHGSAKQKDAENYTNEDRGRMLRTSKDTLDSIRDSYNTDEIRDKMDPNWNRNLAKNPAQGRLNGKSFKSTMNLSRTADALNNRRHWTAGDIGARTLAMGSSGINLPKSERWEPIQTQDMRQMRADENIDFSRRSSDIRRQADTLDYSVELQKRAEQGTFAIANLLNTSDVNIQNAMRNAAVNINMNMPAQQRFAQLMQQFAQELALKTGNRKMQLVADAYNKHGDALGMLYAQYWLGRDGYTRSDAANSKVIQDLYSTFGNDPEMFNYMKSITGLMTSMGIASMAMGPF